MADAAAKRSADGPSNDSPAPKKSKKDKASGGGGDPDDATKKKKKNAESELIKSLLEKDADLRRRFVKAMGDKPPGITNAAFVRQFWATRQHLLKAHAFELDQSRAMHNVFAEFKPREDAKAGAAPGDESSKKLKLSPDQIEDMFRLHPVVRRAFNETVPKQIKDTRTFFREFFNSRLFKKLKGERILDEDPLIPALDAYLEAETRADAHVPHFIDLEGNEQNHSQRKGNQPDLTMRPGASADKVVDLLRAINTTSGRILSNAGGSDGPAFQPVGLDEDTYNQLRLRDLQTDAGSDRILLNLKDQNAIHVGPSKASNDAARKLSSADPVKSLKTMETGLKTTSKANAMDLSAMISFPSTDDADDDDEDEDDENAAPHTTTSALRRAATQIQHLIQHQTEASRAPDASARTDMAGVAAQLNLPEGTLQELVLTHQTTNEFLHYFWAVATSATLAADDLAQAAGALDGSVQRMEAAGAAQEGERAKRLAEVRDDARREQARLVQAGLKRKVVVDEAKAGPGQQEVAWLMAPMARAVGVAQARSRQLASAAAAAAVGKK